ncbi:hypothetical protein DAI22_09g087100 [Oryza sativa Japonica Group]|nr:hypothetical protein DAI22_09g087100 [Oryza sativa Japonica Group]
MSSPPNLLVGHPLRCSTRPNPSSSPCCGTPLRWQRRRPPPPPPSFGVGRRSMRRLEQVLRRRTR